MDWAAAAVAGAGLFGFVSILDKYIIGRVVADVRTYYLLLGLLHVATGGLLLVAAPVEPGASGSEVGLAMASGLVRGTALMLGFFVLRVEEVSRAIQVTHTFPVFVAILAALFMGEALGAGEWVAILVTVAGAVGISSRRGGGRWPVPRPAPFAILVLASLLLAVANVLSKAALSGLSSMNMLSFNSLFMAVAFLAVSLRRPFLREGIRTVVRPDRGSWVALNEVIAFGAMLLVFVSFALGPVSLASTLTALRPFFVFLYAVLLSWLTPRFLEEPLTRRVLAAKLVAILMIVGGTSRIVLG